MPLIAVQVNGFFILESLIKIITYGFWMDKGSYLRDSWSILDFFIVTASILDMSLTSVKLNFIKILRLLRVLRPLRFVSHNRGMKLVVTALLTSASGIASVAVVILMIWLMFDILAVNIIGGKLGYCDFGGATGYSKYYVSKTDCESRNFTWANYDVNFDNVFSGMLSCFILGSQEGWPDIMFIISDADDPTSGPSPGNNSAFAYAFFVVFLLIGTYFLVNLFIGVIFQKFSEAQEKETKGEEGLKKHEKEWLIMQRLIVKEKPDKSLVEPSNDFMKKFFRIIMNPYFDGFIIFCILANIITMALVYDTMSATYEDVLGNVNLFFSAVFFVEMILKIIGLGPKRYWENQWNRFDFFVVMASVVDIIMQFLAQSLSKALRVAPQLARILRVLRVSRLIKLIKKFQGLQRIFNTLVFSLPELVNVGALVLLVFFVFSVLAVFLFGNIQSGKVINDWTNFQSFSNALLTLFACATGENWYIVMFDTFHPKSCVDGSSSCGQPYSGPVFWIAFITIAQYIALNLFILVVIQQFEEYHIAKDNPVEEFKRLHEKIFKPLWIKYTLRHGANKIYESKLVDFFCDLEEPLGYKKKKSDLLVMTRTNVAREIFKLELVSIEGFIHYNDVLYSCFKKAIHPEKYRSRGKAANIMLHEEKITKEKLEIMRRKLLYQELAIAKLKRQYTHGKDTANPLFRTLFVRMTMNAWLHYGEKKEREWEEMSQNSQAELFSESDSDDYESNSESDSDDDFNDLEFHKENSEGSKARYDANLDQVKEENEDESENDDDDSNPNIEEEDTRDKRYSNKESDEVLSQERYPDTNQETDYEILNSGTHLNRRGNQESERHEIGIDLIRSMDSNGLITSMSGSELPLMKKFTKFDFAEKMEEDECERPSFVYNKGDKNQINFK